MIAGIDPGITGALALLGSGASQTPSATPELFATDPRGPQASLKVIAVHDLPTMQRGKTGNKQQINAHSLAGLLRRYDIEHAYLELVKGAPRMKGGQSRMGTTSAFNFGHTFGVLEGVLAVLEIPYTLVPPERWKKAAGLVGAEKDVSRTHAIRVFPSIAGELERKKDVGRAEAILIGYYGRRLQLPAGIAA